MLAFSPFFLRSTALFSYISRSRGAIESFSSPDGNMMNPEPPTISTLLQRARRVREKLYGDAHSPPSFLSDTAQLAYPSSSYTMAPDRRQQNGKSIPRGFCNWLLPRAVMIGQYPGMTPESNGPSLNESNLHIQNMVNDAGISLFCCLLTEVPCQSDDAGWRSGDDSDKIYLQLSLRREFPRPFTRYSTIVRKLTDVSVQFIHNPIEDLSVPTNNNSLLNLLSRLIEHLETNEIQDGHNAIYIHCWGGRGRAGLIGSCLVSLLFPEMNSSDVLNFVQRAYSTRLGAANMPDGLRRSPQTEQQRLFVKEFVSLVQDEREQSRKQ